MEHEASYKVSDPPTCPHCKAVMEKFDSRHLDWGTHYLWVCFNNECAFFVRGWKHMEENFGQAASYRYMITPDNGQNFALPWFGLEYMMKYMKVKTACEEPEE